MDARDAQSLEPHEASNLFPLDEDNLATLAVDISKHGLLTPIELLDGKILDGRRRYKACEMAGVEIETVDVSPSDPVAYVLSLNLHRRHLTPSQLSMVAARARAIYDREAKERYGETVGRPSVSKSVENFPSNTKSSARDAAGKAVGVSGRTVDFATKVLTNGTPELIKAVDEGRMAVSTAAVHAFDPPEVQREAASDPKRNRTYQSISKPRGTATDNGQSKPEQLPEGVSRGKGVALANEAIDCLKRIPKNDALRKRGFQIVTDWIKHNK